MLDTKLSDFIKANIKALALGCSYIPASASEIEQLVIATLAEETAKITGPAPVLDFIEAGEQLIITGTAAFGTEAVKKLGADLAEAISDGAHEKYFQVFTDGLGIIKDVKEIVKENKK